MATLLRCRAGTLNGITNYKDLLTAAGASTTTTAIVNTTAAGNNIPWTTSAGGAAIAWVSPPLTQAVTISGTISFTAAGLQAAMTTNSTVGVKIYKRTQDGTETQFSDTTDNGELGTTRGNQTWSDAAPTSTGFAVGDQIVVKWESDEFGAGAMAVGTATLYYDGTDAGGYECTVNFTETFSVSSTYGTIEEIPTKSLTLTGNAPTVGISPVISVATKTLTLTGIAPTATVNAIDQVTAGAVTIAGQAPSLVFGIGIRTGIGNLSLGVVNRIRNSTMQGAVIGVIGSGGSMPSGWNTAAVTGITREIVATGTLGDGSPYFDLRIYGTNSSGGYGYPDPNPLYNGAAAYFAGVGQTWTSSIVLSTIAGDRTGFQYATNKLFLDEKEEAGGWLVSSSVDLTEGVRTSVSRTLVGSAIKNLTYVTTYVSFAVANGNTVDITVRIAAPQLEFGALSGVYVPTYGGIVGVGSTPTDLINYPVQLYPSTNISAGGTTATTRQLTAPAGKVDGDFQAGKISDDTNPIPSLDLASNKWTELEWAIQFTDLAPDSTEYEFRLSNNGTAIGQSIQVTATAGAGASIINVGAGSLALVGNAPTVGISPVFAVGAGALTLAGQAPTKITNYIVAPSTGAVNCTGSTPVKVVDFRDRQPTAGSVVLAGSTPTILISFLGAVTQGTLTLAGQVPTLKFTFVASPATTALTLTGQQPAVNTEAAFTPALGSLVLTGSTPSPGISYTFSVGTGSVDLSGQTPIKSVDFKDRQPAAGTLTFVGQVPVVHQKFVFIPTTGAVSLAGQTPTINAASLVSVGQGSLALTGQAPSLKFDLVASPAIGTLVLSGQQPFALSGAMFAPTTGALVLAGSTPSSGVSYTFAVGVGSVSLEGQVPVKNAASNFSPETKALVLTGSVPQLSSVALPGVGALILTGSTPSTLITAAYDVPTKAVTITGAAPTAYVLGTNQIGFRWRNDDNTEALATWRVAQDANNTLPKNVTVRLRVVLDGKGDPVSQQFQLEYRKVGDSVWAKVA